MRSSSYVLGTRVPREAVFKSVPALSQARVLHTMHSFPGALVLISNLECGH